MQVCRKRVEAAIQAFADEVYDGDWQQVTVAEVFGITKICMLHAERRYEIDSDYDD